MFRNKIILGTGFLVLFGFSQAFGASLWLNGRDLYSSQGSREFKPGDIITIVVNEESTAQQAATTNTQDDSSLEVKTTPSIPFFD